MINRERPILPRARRGNTTRAFALGGEPSSVLDVQSRGIPVAARGEKLLVTASAGRQAKIGAALRCGHRQRQENPGFRGKTREPLPAGSQSPETNQRRLAARPEPRQQDFSIPPSLTPASITS